MPDSQSRPSTDDSPWDDLVVSILSVSSYSIVRTYDSLPRLRNANIVDPSSLASWEPMEIEVRLKASGYDRGSFMMKLVAKRLSALGRLIRTKGVDECEKIIGSRD